MVGIVSVLARIIKASDVVEGVGRSSAWFYNRYTIWWWRVASFDVGVCSAPWSWIWTLRVVGRLGSSRERLKFGWKVNKTLPAWSVVRTVPTTTCWYCLNLVSRRAILAVTGKPFLPWRVRINLTPPRWICVYHSRFQFVTRSVGISKVTYCSLWEACKAH